MDPKQLKKLKDTWERKLEKDGLGDIEQADGKLKAWSTRFLHKFRYRDQVDLSEAVEQYSVHQRHFELAGQFLHEHEFKNRREKRIWELYCQGLSIREITAKIRTEKRPIDKMQVQEIRSKLLQEMKGLFKK